MFDISSQPWDLFLVVKLEKVLQEYQASTILIFRNFGGLFDNLGWFTLRYCLGWFTTVEFLVWFKTGFDLKLLNSMGWITNVK